VGVVHQGSGFALYIPTEACPDIVLSHFVAKADTYM